MYLDCLSCHRMEKVEPILIRDTGFPEIINDLCDECAKKPENKDVSRNRQ